MDKRALLKEKNILYVEDDRETVELFTMMFEKYVNKMDSAYNGRDGLELFINNRPDIVITDIEMPVMNGIELLEKIKDIDPSIPVIVITAFRDEAHMAKKASEIIIKPINKNDVLLALENLC